jgi:hypothetical protein
MTVCPEKLDPANSTDSSVSPENANQTEASSLLGHGFALSHFDRSEKFSDLLLDSPTGLLDSTDGLISSNAQMDLLLAPDFSSPTASAKSHSCCDDCPQERFTHCSIEEISRQTPRFSLAKNSYWASNCRKNCKKTNFPS